MNSFTIEENENQNRIRLKYRRSYKFLFLCLFILFSFPMLINLIFSTHLFVLSVICLWGLIFDKNWLIIKDEKHIIKKNRLCFIVYKKEVYNIYDIESFFYTEFTKGQEKFDNSKPYSVRFGFYDKNTFKEVIIYNGERKSNDRVKNIAIRTAVFCEKELNLQ